MTDQTSIGPLGPPVPVGLRSIGTEPFPQHSRELSRHAHHASSLCGEEQRCSRRQVSSDRFVGRGGSRLPRSSGERAAMRHVHAEPAPRLDSRSGQVHRAHSPQHVEWCAQIRMVPVKKGINTSVTYLEKPETDALLAAPDPSSSQGARDHALLLFLYNSGARVSEAASLRIGDIDWHARSVRIMGKGSKERRCPLWAIPSRPSSPCRPAAQRRACVPEPPWRAHYALRHSHHGRAVRREATSHQLRRFEASGSVRT